MGTESFLVGVHASSFSNLDDAIESLRDSSYLFVRRFRDGDFRRAGEISNTAFSSFDHISNEIIRIRDASKKKSNYSGTPFEGEMNKLAAKMVTPVSLIDQNSIRNAGAGRGALPAGLSAPQDITLEKLLNKIKHRDRQNLNFRIDGERHIFVICCHNPDDITEFDVIEFCDMCRQVVPLL